MGVAASSSVLPSTCQSARWIIEKDDRLDYDTNDIGKWMYFFPRSVIDDRWNEALELYRAGTLQGIVSMKVSSAMSNPSSSGKDHVIIFYCGPAHEESRIMEIGRKLVAAFPPATRTIYYKSDEQTTGGTRATGQTKNSLYSLSGCRTRPNEPRDVKIEPEADENRYSQPTVNSDNQLVVNSDRNTAQSAYQLVSETDTFRQQQQSTFAPGGSAGMAYDNTLNIIFPISAIDPYQEDCTGLTIRGKVLSKDQIRVWDKPDSSGKIFSVIVTDGDGVIKVCAFDEEVDRFFNNFEVGKTYYIKDGTVRKADERYSSGRSYDMVLSANSVVETCPDDMGEVKSQYKFVSFMELPKLTINDSIDVVGICLSAGDLVHGKAKHSGRDFVKRDLGLVDQNNTRVRVTLWGSQAEKIDKDQVMNHVVAIRGCILNEFNGVRNLTTVFETVIEVDPDIPEAHKLTGWYHQEGLPGCAVPAQ